MAGCQVVVEDHKHQGNDAVVVQGPAGGVVAQVGRDAGRHRNQPHRPPLPLQEEGLLLAVPFQQTEGVGAHRVKAVVVGEEPGGPPCRVELYHLAALATRLIRQHRQEPVDGLGVLQVAQQLAAAGAVDVAPGQRRFRLHRGGAPALPGQPHGGPIQAGQHRQPPIRKGQTAAFFRTRGNYQSQLPDPFQHPVEPGAPHSHQLPQVGRLQPGPVGQQVQGALLGGLQQSGQQAGRTIAGGGVHLQACGKEFAAWRHPGGQFPSGKHVVQHFPQA